jgi:hypothetical protein
MILIFASLLVAHPAQPLGPLPFAEGPAARVSAITAAIATCHAPAKVVRSGKTATVFLANSRSDRTFDCLSAWIANHPDTGFVKLGFVGRERQ